MSYRICRGIPEQHRAEAARLYWRAFGSKLRRVLGPDWRAVAFVERVLDATHCYSALSEDGQQLYGVAGFRTVHGAFVGGDKADLRAIYGWFGALWRLCALWVLSRDQEHKAMVVDGVSVRSDQRSQGIGAALIEALCTEARRRGFVQIRLDVIVENMRARALYERLGFRMVRARDSRLTELLFSYRTVLTMVRPLEPWSGAETRRAWNMR